MLRQPGPNILLAGTGVLDIHRCGTHVQDVLQGDRCVTQGQGLLPVRLRVLLMAANTGSSRGGWMGAECTGQLSHATQLGRAAEAVSAAQLVGAAVLAVPVGCPGVLSLAWSNLCVQSTVAGAAALARRLLIAEHLDSSNTAKQQQLQQTFESAAVLGCIHGARNVCKEIRHLCSLITTLVYPHPMPAIALGQ